MNHYGPKDSRFISEQNRRPWIESNLLNCFSSQPVSSIFCSAEVRTGQAKRNSLILGLLQPESVRNGGIISETLVHDYKILDRFQSSAFWILPGGSLHCTTQPENRANYLAGGGEPFSLPSLSISRTESRDMSR